MFRTETIVEGVQLHALPTSKFKTITFRVYVQTALGDNTALTALLPMVMSRGSARLRTMQAIASHLADLYGARFGCDVSKIGERHCVEFYFEIPGGAYVEEGREVLERGVATLVQLVCDPWTDGAQFDPEYVAREKLNLINRVNSLINDKRSYALQRFYETMFVGEPFSIFKYGTIEEIKNATPQALWQHYRAVMSHSPIDIFVVGDVDLGVVKRRWTEGLSEWRDGYRPLPSPKQWPAPTEARQVQEQGDLQQGILLFGYRTPITYKSPDYYKLLVYNGVLGSFPHSKLFINVREQASLAYYVWARLEASKGFLMINAGIHPDNYDKAVQIILNQIKEMNQGNISSEELAATKRGLISGVLTMEDSAMAVIDRGITGVINGVRRDMEAAIDAIRQVTIGDLVEQGRQLQLDTIYFLRGHPLAHFDGAATRAKGARVP